MLARRWILLGRHEPELAEIVRRLAAEEADVCFTYRTGQDEAGQVAGQVIYAAGGQRGPLRLGR